MSNRLEKVQLIATAAFGLEAVVARELSSLGYTDLETLNGRVAFSSDLSGICRANLWLRSADRVVLKVGEFEARSFDELFEKTRVLNWADWIPEDGRFPVEGRSVRSTLHSVPDCQAIVKKAIVESMKRRYRRSWFDETGPVYAVEVALLKDVATLTIDTSGAGLHKRGYREVAGGAPLKETLAAALVLLSGWRPGRFLLDPMCGSGTIPIEAALIGLNRAPGLRRAFAAESWRTLPRNLWIEARSEARDLERRDGRLEVYGSDADPGIVGLARENAGLAGLGSVIRFTNARVEDLKVAAEYGCVICNPPYGERLGELREAESLYRSMGRVFSSIPTWSLYILSPHPRFERIFGRLADKKRKLYNGRIECHYYQFFGPRPPRTASGSAGPSE
ncbi:MAG: class I SAM-dependent RNA methyltransferase [Firmicutes bacterium]|nr:class I SAM-dependent RNA methyltransferase [Bacillota bacterium]